MKAENIISLGMNCEVSFQIEKYVKKLDASLFSWAFIEDEDLFLEALNHIDEIFEGDISFKAPTPDMFLCEKYQIAFHGRTPGKLMFDSNWTIKNQKIYDKTVDELRSRIRYLKQKFMNQINSEKYTVFLKKLMVEGDYIKAERIITGLRDYLEAHNERKNYTLVIVIEEKYDNSILRSLENDNLVIRTVSYFSPVTDTKNGADNIGWSRIFREILYGEKVEEDWKMINGADEQSEVLKEIYDKMKYYELQCKQYQYENEKLQELLQKKDEWIAQLQTGKDWLENQYKSLIKLSEEERQELVRGENDI